MATVIHARRPLLAGDVATSNARIASPQPNFLSLEQRPLHPAFDTDGPGYLSVNGPRHDNDHINIGDIQILPTTDEILAVQRPPWMPEKNVAEPHFLAPGPLRLFDTLFRHLRYDSVESIRDVCYHASQFLTLVQATRNDEDLKIQLGQTQVRDVLPEIRRHPSQTTGYDTDNIPSKKHLMTIDISSITMLESKSYLHMSKRVSLLE